jgi:Rod binding domain-containing protein
MRFDKAMTAQAGQTGAMDAQADKLLKLAKSDAAGAAPTSKEDAKIAKAGRDFESILLGSWLQQAENSFGTVPGGDGQDDDSDSGKDQFQGISMQALAGKLSASGGIGIAKMISSHLHAAAKTEKGTESAGKAEISEKKKIS